MTTATAALVLALDTATRRASVALCRGETLLCEGSREVTTHSEGLMPLVEETLERCRVGVQELGAVVCGRGPGSFTGLRIGMATAKGLCLAADVPLYCGSSLQALALSVDALSGDGPGGATASLVAAPGEATASLVVAVLDARRKEVYLGLFDRGEPLMQEVVCEPARVAEHLPQGVGDRPLVLAGDGALAYQEVLLGGLGDRATLAPEGCHHVEARHLAGAARARIAAGDADDLGAAVPLYIRSSDARLPAIAQDRRPAGVD